jgi:hypothetical protein
MLGLEIYETEMKGLTVIFEVFLAVSRNVSCGLQGCDALYSTGVSDVPGFDTPSICVYMTTRSYLPGGYLIAER